MGPDALGAAGGQKISTCGIAASRFLLARVGWFVAFRCPEGCLRVDRAVSRLRRQGRSWIRVWPWINKRRLNLCKETWSDASKSPQLLRIVVDYWSFQCKLASAVICWTCACMLLVNLCLGLLCSPNFFLSTSHTDMIRRSVVFLMLKDRSTLLGCMPFQCWSYQCRSYFSVHGKMQL